jgi:hypothetical protein
VLARLILPFYDLPCLTCELKDVQASVRAIDDVNITAVVRGDIVRLDHPATDVRIALIGPAPIIRVRGYSGMKKATFCGLYGSRTSKARTPALKYETNTHEVSVRGAGAPLIEKVRFAEDSPLEGDGFEPSVPRDRVMVFSRTLRPRLVPRDRPTVRALLAPPTESASPMRRD